LEGVGEGPGLGGPGGRLGRPHAGRQQQAQHPEGHGPGGVQEEHQQTGHHQDDEAGHDDVARPEAVIEPPGPDGGDAGHDEQTGERPGLGEDLPHPPPPRVAGVGL